MSLLLGGSAPTTTRANSIESPVLPYDPDSSDLTNGYFRWSGFGSLFDVPGTYRVFYYVHDADTEEVSSHLLTTVYRTLAENQPPEAVLLLHPEPHAVAHSSPLFVWEPSADPDEDAITYRLELARAPEFADILLRKEGIDGTTGELDPEEALEDDQTHYWRVTAVDEFGAESLPSEVRSLIVDNTNGEVPGTVSGVARSEVDNGELAGVTVTLRSLTNGAERSATTRGRGDYR